MKPLQRVTTLMLGLSCSSFVAGCASKPAEPAVTPPVAPASAAPATPALTASAAATVASPSHPTRVFFGDTHLHTALSLDAGAAGGKLLPAEAYRFAKGEEVTSASGQKAKLWRPLDFLVVSDHSDQMGFITDLAAGSRNSSRTRVAKKWHDWMAAGKGMQAAMDLITTFAQGKFPKEIMYSPGTAATQPP